MAKLTANDTKHVAVLAKLNLTDKEISKFTTQLSKVVDLMDELKEVDTKDIKPTSQTTKLTNILRPDEIKEDQILTQDQALSGKDTIQNGFFVVPQIINKNA